jgi:hypothetical protein
MSDGCQGGTARLDPFSREISMPNEQVQKTAGTPGFALCHSARAAIDITPQINARPTTIIHSMDPSLLSGSKPVKASIQSCQNKVTTARIPLAAASPAFMHSDARKIGLTDSHPTQPIERW